MICHPTAGHGGFLLDKAYRQQVVDNMQQVLSKGSLLAAKAPVACKL